MPGARFSVGLNTIVEAIQAQGLKTVEDIGKALKAGSNCGFCIPEIKTLIEEHERH